MWAVAGVSGSPQSLVGVRVERSDLLEGVPPPKQASAADLIPILETFPQPERLRGRRARLARPTREQQRLGTVLAGKAKADIGGHDRQRRPRSGHLSSAGLISARAAVL